MQNVELTRLAGHVVDILSTLGYSAKDIHTIGDLVQRHAAVMDKYEAEAAVPAPALAHSIN